MSDKTLTKDQISEKEIPEEDAQQIIGGGTFIWNYKVFDNSGNAVAGFDDRNKLTIFLNALKAAGDQNTYTVTAY